MFLLWRQIDKIKVIFFLAVPIVKIEKIKKFELEADQDPTKVSKEDSDNH